MERDQELKCGGHFLIMDTGHGKTVTSLLYAYRLDPPHLVHLASYRLQHPVLVSPEYFPSSLPIMINSAMCPVRALSAATSHPKSMNVP